MNDRYLYRAKHVHVLQGIEHLEGRWIEGYLSDENHINSPKLEGEFLIDPSTICQCTGLKDKNGKLIWENDVVRVKYTDGQEEYQENAKVSYTKRGFSPFSWEYYCDGCDVRCEILEIEVTGNIFDEGSENIGKGAEEN